MVGKKKAFAEIIKLSNSVETKTLEENLYISKPLLPDLAKLNAYLERIWDSKWVTNNGSLHIELEMRLAERLQVPTAMLFNNGTIGLMVALKLFDLPPGSEVITTPMTFAATAHSIAWNGLKPVFADVTEDNLTIDPEAVEAAITANTSAILAVHCYGCICDHEALSELAHKHGLKLVYDAAHAFGATLDGRSVASLGDASVFSFHATKLYNTLEGGLLTTNNEADRERIYLLRNFGILNEEQVVGIGINGKMNEVQAAIGLLNLEVFEDERLKRRALRRKYHELLDDIDGIVLQTTPDNVVNSEQYFLVRVDSEVYGKTRDDIKADLEEKKIFPRKYFHPNCNDYDCYRDYPIVTDRERPYVEKAKSEVLCLPFHSGVEALHLEMIHKVFCG
jgi:dTDP-4-amino-4,6-dideoxygalactose transaminase